MTDNTKLKVVLLALTGFGNAVLDALLKDTRVNVEAVFTEDHDQSFPYYLERQLLEECAEKGIVYHADVKVNSSDGINLLHKYSPDLIIVATFKQIIKENILDLPRLGVINFHPSLLPKYRGPCPTNAVLLNNEKYTGVTVHYITKNIDEGNVLLQKKIRVGKIESDGALRKKLANLSGELVPEIIGMFIGQASPKGRSQVHISATFAPKPKMEDGYLELETDIDTIKNKMRAYNPLPGTSFLIGDQRINLNRFELFRVDRPDGVYDNKNNIEVIINSKAIRLFKKA